mmetsp:Transcript_19247/g.41588  ORF Transcript_19247/g.41588 Transcript_19247/m.41588 type:complete len:232 (+) Transcript_19247:140-835(+)
MPLFCCPHLDAYNQARPGNRPQPCHTRSRGTHQKRSKQFSYVFTLLDLTPTNTKATNLQVTINGSPHDSCRPLLGLRDMQQLHAPPATGCANTGVTAWGKHITCVMHACQQRKVPHIALGSCASKAKPMMLMQNSMDAVGSPRKVRLAGLLSNKQHGNGMSATITHPHNLMRYPHDRQTTCKIYNSPNTYHKHTKHEAVGSCILQPPSATCQQAPATHSHLTTHGTTYRKQ